MLNKLIFHLFRYSYTLLYSLCLPLYMIVLKKKYKDSKTKLPFQQRINRKVTSSKKTFIWIHCASFGEVQGCSNLITTLINSKENIMVTTITASGAALLEKKFSNKIYYRYLPFDLPFLIDEFHKIHKIKLLILMEKELWPNILTLTNKNKIPIVLVNARLDKKSLNRYKLTKNLTEKLLEKCHHIACISQKDKENFKELNVPDHKISICKNLKSDIQINPKQIKNSLLLKAPITHRLILTAVSTHDGEEEIIIKLWKELLKKIPTLLLILIPRHPHRIKKIFLKHDLKRLKTSLHSQHKKPKKSDHIYLVDTLGEALSFINLSDLVLLGGSWVPIGGHNFLEAALLKKCIIVGPYMNHFEEIFETFLKEKAILQEDNTSKLYKICYDLLNADVKREAYGKKAYTMAKQEQGSNKKHLQVIRKILNDETI